MALFLFSQNITGPITRSTNYSDLSSSVQMISDSISGLPLIYIVNMTNNNGYVIISANKKSTPILAFSETGHFNPQNESGAMEYQKNIKQRF